MKTTIWKTLALCTLALMLLVSASALGEARYPTLNGTVTDDANALSQTMTNDVAAYAAKLENDAGVKLHVAMVQFLDGEAVQTYANTLFTRWELGDADVLILGAAAEDSFAIVTGADVKAKLSDSNVKNLLYTSGFSDAFKSQHYDAALGSLLVSFNDLIAKQYGDQIALGELFKAYQPSAQGNGTATQNANPLQDTLNAVVDTSSQLWTSTMNSISNSVENYQNYHQQRDESGSGLTPGGWIVLIVIVLIVLGQSGPMRRVRHGGCGCSPIGWIVGGLGLGALFNRRHDEDGRRYGDDYRRGRDEYRRERNEYRRERDEYRRERRG